jgi:hypothetical protein
MFVSQWVTTACAPKHAAVGRAHGTDATRQLPEHLSSPPPWLILTTFQDDDVPSSAEHSAPEHGGAIECDQQQARTEGAAEASMWR